MSVEPAARPPSAASADLYRTKSAPENLATHWATSPFYLSYWMLIRRSSSQCSRAFVVSLCGSLPACHATCSSLHLAAAGMTRGHAPPAAAHGTRLSPHRHPLPPPLADLIYWNEWSWLHIKSRSTACSFYYYLIFSSKPDRYSPPLTRFIYLIWDYWFIWRFAYKIKEKQYCMQLYYCLLFSSKSNRYSPLLTRLFQVVLYDSYIWFETYWFIFRLWLPNILIFL